ncbi:MAG: aldo/keto reductase [Nitrospirae bacterium]|nr:aldo/keto reductase [Nitrospirota bacterium]
MLKDKILLPLDSSSAYTPWLWIGTWSMGGEGFGSHDERESLRVLRTAVDHNIRHFDTAGFYAHGKSESLLQKILRSDRRDFFISSKGGIVWSGREVRHRASPEDLKRQLYESLDRLKTDYLDLYQLHWPDPEVPISESIAALKSFQRQGLIRYWGVGNLTALQLKTTLRTERNIPHQAHFNPVHQDHDVLLAGQDLCINCIVSPLEQGLLGGGKSSSGMSGLGKRDLRNRNPCFSNPEVLKWNCRLNELVNKHSLSKVSVVLMWICSRPNVHAVIPGPREIGQLNELLEFKTEVERSGLASAGEDVSILSDEKTMNKIPDELWQHLNKGPENSQSVTGNGSTTSFSPTL